MSFRSLITALFSIGLFACPGAIPTEPTSLRGIVSDAFRDDVDEEFSYLTLERNGETTFVSTRSDDTDLEFPKLQSLIGCDVTVTGAFRRFTIRSDRRVLKGILIRSSESAITVHAPPSRNAFDAPDLIAEPPDYRTVDSCGPRKVRGGVIARWHGDTVLLRVTNDTVRVSFQDNWLPELGETVEAVGRVTTDLYRFNLERAQGRVLPAAQAPCAEVRRVSLDGVFSTGGHRIINSDHHGQAICVSGKLKSVLSDEFGRNRFLVQDGAYQIIVDCSALPHALDGLKEGSELEVTGVGVLESENWHPGLAFPKVSGLFLVPRTADDIRILRQPPWWTPARMTTVVLGLLAILAAILVWNASLRLLVAHKSRALLREQAKTLSETLKIDERTRLAAELHDFHSQNLTAIAYQISSARNACADDPSKAQDLLATAARMLKSCRTDLRHCLWDLRSDALNETDFATAIRETVTPVAGAAKVSVRFAGRRSQISDTTAHAILSILRELTANAVVHGHATVVRIAGEQRPQAIRFSVEDNGCGFDPSVRPGQIEGHFGLDGIQERLNRLGGVLDIKSSPGKGTYVRLSISPPHPLAFPSP